MSTPLKHYESSDGFTPSTNNRSSTHDFASPSTALTPYSPELVRKVESDLDGLINGLSLKSKAARNSVDDPFVGDGVKSSIFNLSATAADYAPLTAPAPATAPPFARNSSSQTAVVTRHVKPNSSPVVNFTLAEVTRYVKINGPPDDEAGMTRIKDVKTMEASIATKKLDDGSLIFRFDHVKEAQIACNTTRSLFSIGSFPPGWSAEFVTAADFHGDHSRDYEGQLKVAITYQGKGKCTEALLRDIAVATIEASAEILSSSVKNFEADKTLLLMDIWLASVRAAESISNKYNREWKTLPENPDFDFFVEHNCSKYPMSSKPWVSSRSALLFRGQGQFLPPYNNYGSNTLYCISPEKKDSKVDIEAIENGGDVRTTVMIRNIPNKIDAALFKTILDEHVFGRYDFSYLRIDFTNNCNVGYAFVNFKNPRDIITLYKGLVGKPWEVFSSDKIADVCYATNQGLGTCIEKFRNSSVMLEWSPHRPKLWYTLEDGPELAGKEKPFPEPSNLQKLHRSRANASSIGLFPPRGVQVSALGLSPTRATRGDLPNFGPPASFGQFAVRHSKVATPFVPFGMPNQSPTYATDGYSNNPQLAAAPYGTMHSYTPNSSACARSGFVGISDPVMGNFGIPGSAFMPTTPYVSGGAGVTGHF
ncbi:uncharacterized protein PV09_00370 [Verruconis gallopava]|uniref:RRM domain-containing protein n=1 Tax=Verruconis gallopava TaxID=253628 RepID=A0A0D1Z946_9PEZI|nr:uncharacterized protein PV09_00370 [Verruconis gallopava]KIW09492.1 hypothetical protein PV09_00370 [Verruconis gallopava]